MRISIELEKRFERNSIYGRQGLVTLPEGNSLLIGSWYAEEFYGGLWEGIFEIKGRDYDFHVGDLAMINLRILDTEEYNGGIEIVAEEALLEGTTYFFKGELIKTSL